MEKQKIFALIAKVVKTDDRVVIAPVFKEVKRVPKIHLLWCYGHNVNDAFDYAIQSGLVYTDAYGVDRFTDKALKAWA